DLEGVAVHEFIHCYGISHSAIAGNFNSSGHEVHGSFSGDFTQQATMFPFHSGTTNDRSLHGDDIAALGDLYPNATTAANLGTISGTVQTGGGSPVVGAHVVAVSTAAPNIPVAGFMSNTDVTAGGTGAYRLLVPPGNYFVRVEPIIGFPNRFTQGNVSHPVTFMSNFPPEFYSGVNESAADAMPDNVQSDAAAVTVMAGQTTSGINIVVNSLAAFTNDNFSGARVISTVTFREAVDATLATTEGTDPTGACFAGLSAFTAWYRFTAPSNANIIFSAEGSHYDTAVAAFTGSPGSFAQVACSEDLGTPDFRSNLQSKITFSATAGTTYHFVVSDSQFVSPPEFLLVVNLSVEANPVPSLSSLSPSSAVAGSAGFTLTVNGSSFINGSVVRWNGSDRTTTFINANQLQATIPASDLVNAGAAQVTVFNPMPGGGTSNSLPFNVLSPVISSLLPDVIPATSPGFELTVNGSNFLAGSVVRWKGMNRTTMFVSSTQLKASIPASDVAAAGTAQVTVLNSAGGISNAATFTINIRNPLPTITGLNPPGVLTGSGGFMLGVVGSNFVFNSVVRWNGSDRPTTFVNSGLLQAAISAGDVSAMGMANVTVFSPGPGGGTSNTKVFNIQNSSNLAPTTSSLMPAIQTAG
ncbi:MAG: IPT/TIG domain-containing protein, partial [Candidatus Acidiferrales bacterium]